MKNNNSKRKELIKFLNGTMYISMIYVIISVYIHHILFSQSVTRVDKIIFAIVGIVFCIWLFLCQQESLNDDSKTAKEMFSVNISLVALIVSMVALLRGV